MKRYISLFILFFITLLVFAQDFEVAPVMLSFNAEPGDLQTKTINIKNHGNKKLSILLTVEDYLIDNKGDRNYLTANSTKNSIANSLSLNPSFVDIEPNEEKEISVTVQAPIDDYSTKWGVIYLTAASEQEAFSADKGLHAGIGVSARISVQVSQSPASNKNVDVKINNLREITKPDSKDRTFQANIENMGDKITTCKIYLLASNIKTAEEIQLDPINVTIYPKNTRVVELTLPEGKLTKGQYSLAAILDYGSTSSLEGTQIMIEVK